MTLITNQIKDYLERSSWIRKMFETGMELKAKHGEDAVCDFSLGNPDLPPPGLVRKALADIAGTVENPFALGYMPNAGYPDVRAKLAAKLAAEQNAPVQANDIVLTCGAAGGLNCVFKAVLDPCAEVLVPAPFFVEYGFYAQNHGGGLVTVKAKAPDFSLDVDAMAAAITEKTRVVLVNSPNNPTGAIYSRQELEALAAALTKAGAKYGKPILLISDEPYRFLTYDGVQVPSILDLYPHAIVINSYSKSLSLAGERIGYVCVNPNMPGKDELLAGIILANRILGFVNAPAIGQKVLGATLDASEDAQVDASVYAARRDAMAKVLDNAGLDYVLPKGGFYFFIPAPEKFKGDDVAFVNALQEQLILAVPGSGFGYPGYVRLTFCVGQDVIERSAGGFKKV